MISESFLGISIIWVLILADNGIRVREDRAGQWFRLVINRVFLSLFVFSVGIACLVIRGSTLLFGTWIEVELLGICGVSPRFSLSPIKGRSVSDLVLLSVHKNCLLFVHICIFLRSMWFWVVLLSYIVVFSLMQELQFHIALCGMWIHWKPTINFGIRGILDSGFLIK